MQVFHQWWVDTFGDYGGMPMPEVGMVFDYVFNLQNASMCSWAEMVSSTIFAGKNNLAEVLVSTPAQVILAHDTCACIRVFLCMCACIHISNEG
jgi:hypothetical protein